MRGKNDLRGGVGPVLGSPYGGESHDKTNIPVKGPTKNAIPNIVPRHHSISVAPGSTTRYIGTTEIVRPTARETKMARSVKRKKRMQPSICFRSESGFCKPILKMKIRQ